MNVPAMNGRSNGEDANRSVTGRQRPDCDNLSHTVRLASAPLDLPFMAGHLRGIFTVEFSVTQDKSSAA